MIRTGFARQDNGVVIAGALLVALLALLTEVLLAVVSWVVTPGQKQLPFTRGRNRRPVDEPVDLPAAAGRDELVGAGTRT